MAQKPTVEIHSFSSQKDQRYPDTFYDQHKSARFPNGRPWTGYREFTSQKGQRDGFTGGDLIPGRHVEPGEDKRDAWADSWHAPWTPEFRFFKMDYARNRIVIEYDKVIAYDKAARDRYYRAAALMAASNSWKEVQYGTIPQFAITAKIGLPPRSPKIAEAAKVGDPWLLGQLDDVNVELAKLLDISPDGLAIVREESAPPTTPDAVIAASENGTLAALMAKMAEMEQTIKTLSAPKKSHHKKPPAASAA